MFTFKDYLVEAQFSEDDLARVIGVFERRLPKLLGTKIYRYGGKGHVMEFGGFSEILYLFGERAFGVRFKGGHVLGIDVWEKYTTNNGPSHFIDVKMLNAGSLIGAMTKLANLIKHPEQGKYPVQAVNEGLQLDEMAKRVNDDNFYRMAVSKYGEHGAESMTWEQIKAVADENDVLIPAYIRGQKIGRGKWNAKPGAVTDVDSKETKSEVVSKKDDEPQDVTPVKEPSTAVALPKKEPILYIKVTAQDPDTKRFIPAAESKAAQQLYKQIAGSMADHKPTEKEMRDPDTLYGHLSQLVTMACKGTLRSLLIYGGPGTGKTYTIMQTIKEEGMVPGKDYVKISGKASPVSIYQTMFMFREGGMILFDDCDSMWGNEDATNILKAALDTSPVREISWNGKNTLNVSKMSDEKRQSLYKQIDRQLAADAGDEDAELLAGDEDVEDDAGVKVKKGGPIRFPSMFEFKGRVVFISNLKKEEFDSAIMSRSAKINMDLTPEEVLKRMRSVLPSLGGDDVAIDKKEELLDHLVEMHGEGALTQVTMREFVKGMLVLRSGAPNWRDLCQYM